MRRYPPYYYHYPPYPKYCYPLRQYLPVDPKMFMNSARKMDPLIKDAQALMRHISTTEAFAKKLMDAAQHSKINEVKKMISETGIKSKSEIRFNPSGLILILTPKNDPSDCCHVELRVRWM
ncbi:hypothetical protein [Bacillus sp. FJAT-49736]|uniref:hypothetical protein n=1 Tax=Bacillus sp. FJAT-49736 TaxID=2833582 RepID=UPI001BC98A66|nr:hypothetical protein [Bacillus sp. FJAT-49736]MBS4173929.1 hypothetical protein [Bacillus sp. FJAT-49736]